MDSQHPQELPSSTNEGFIYTAMVHNSTCTLFEDESSMFPKLGEMKIESEWFKRHQDCQDDALNLLTAFSKLVEKQTGKKQLVATQINPQYEADYDPEMDANPWDETIVMKMYLADALVAWETGTIESTIEATIRAAPRINLVDSTRLNAQ